MDEAKKLIVLEQENEELKRELRELFKTLDQMNQSLNRMIDPVRRRRRDKRRAWIRWKRRGSFIPDGAGEKSNQKLNSRSNMKAA